MEQQGKFLVCADGRDTSKAALNFACKKAAKKGGMVEVLHVITPDETAAMFGVMDKMREEQRHEAEILMKAMTEAAFQQAGVTPSIQIREGRLGEEIINAALEDSNVNMLVLGISQRSTDGRSLASWLTERLGDRLLIPIMLVPGNLTDLQMDELS